MLALLKGAWQLVTGNRHYLTVVCLACAAAALYAWGATGRADRANLITWAATACASAGAKFEGDGPRGKKCAARVNQLARFERETLAASSAVLADAMIERDRKSAADLAAATRNANTAAAAAQIMEQANATVSHDVVGADWFSALNAVAGLRGANR